MAVSRLNFMYAGENFVFVTRKRSSVQSNSSVDPCQWNGKLHNSQWRGKGWEGGMLDEGGGGAQSYIYMGGVVTGVEAGERGGGKLDPFSWRNFFWLPGNGLLSKTT